MSLLCNLQNINLAFGEKVIFKDAKFSIDSNDRVGLIGLNGHGKSTLFNILAGKLEPDTSQPPFIFDKNNESFNLFYIPQELDIASFSQLNIKTFYLSFYPELLDLHLKLEKVQSQLMEDYSNEKLLDQQQKFLNQFEHLDGWNIERSYLNYLETFELSNLDSSLKNLSGGELRKIALSIGLSSKANLVLWDEPTNHLDVETIEKFEDEINKKNNACIIISHDRYLLNHVTNKIIHIENGDIISFQGTYLEYLEYLEEKQKELAKNLDKLENKHRRELAWMRQGIKARGTRSKKRVEGFHNIKDSISDLKSKAKKSVNLNLSHSGRKSKLLLEIKEAQFSYNQKEIFKNLSVSVYRDDKIALIGPNGAGKTTLINILQDKLNIQDGNLKRLDGIKIITFDQKRDSLPMDKTPFDLIGDGQDFVHLPDGSKKHVMSYLENFLFHRDQIKRPIYTLSGGEKNRLQLALFMKQSADLWIFDEPTNDLDIETIELLETELKNYNAAVIIIGHDRAFLDNVCKTTWLLQDKKIEVFDGGYSQVAPYLHALELEKQLNQSSNKDEPQISNEPKPKEKVKVSNKQKQRWAKIEDEISKTENNIEDLKAKMAEFDFSQHSEGQNTLYQKLGEQLHQAEETLAKLYEEWEELSELFQ